MWSFIYILSGNITAVGEGVTKAAAEEVTDATVDDVRAGTTWVDVIVAELSPGVALLEPVDGIGTKLDCILLADEFTLGGTDEANDAVEDKLLGETTVDDTLVRSDDTADLDGVTLA